MPAKHAEFPIDKERDSRNWRSQGSARALLELLPPGGPGVHPRYSSRDWTTRRAAPFEGLPERRKRARPGRPPVDGKVGRTRSANAGLQRSEGAVDRWGRCRAARRTGGRHQARIRAQPRRRYPGAAGCSRSEVSTRAGSMALSDRGQARRSPHSLGLTAAQLRMR